MTKTDWTAEEVRKAISGFAGYCATHHGIGAELMDIATAFAERIEADESAVSVACNHSWRVAGQADHHFTCSKCGEISNFGFTTGAIHGVLAANGFAIHTATPAQEQPGWKVPEGWRLVPIKATEKMRQEGAPHAGYEEEEAYSLDAVWTAMLAASPTPPKEN